LNIGDIKAPVTVCFVDFLTDVLSLIAAPDGARWVASDTNTTPTNLDSVTEGAVVAVRVGSALRLRLGSHIG
jgi:hypothetical protein